MAEFALDPTPRATVRKVLYRGNPGTSDTLLYTSPNLPGGRTEVSRIVVANTKNITDILAGNVSTYDLMAFERAWSSTVGCSGDLY